jgi:hypothetical protein
MILSELEVRRRLESLQRGRIDPVGSLTLTANGTATFTTVTHAACSTTSNVTVAPRNSAAAVEVGGGTLWTVPGNGSFSIFHSATTLTRTFGYSIHSRAVP